MLKYALYNAASQWNFLKGNSKRIIFILIVVLVGLIVFHLRNSELQQWVNIFKGDDRTKGVLILINSIYFLSAIRDFFIVLVLILFILLVTQLLGIVQIILSLVFRILLTDVPVRQSLKIILYARSISKSVKLKRIAIVPFIALILSLFLIAPIPNSEVLEFDWLLWTFYPTWILLSVYSTWVTSKFVYKWDKASLKAIYSSQAYILSFLSQTSLYIVIGLMIYALANPIWFLSIGALTNKFIEFCYEAVYRQNATKEIVQYLSGLHPEVVFNLLSENSFYELLVHNHNNISKFGSNLFILWAIISLLDAVFFFAAKYFLVKETLFVKAVATKFLSNLKATLLISIMAYISNVLFKIDIDNIFSVGILMSFIILTALIINETVDQ
ncbi:MAG TPA: hypothetical protein PLX35_11545 [Cyclobacteriaceae bacterium]|nr:hypothetical protein [Cyclobacteriaceae bacterium]